MTGSQLCFRCPPSLKPVELVCRQHVYSHDRNQHPLYRYNRFVQSKSFATLASLQRVVIHKGIQVSQLCAGQLHRVALGLNSQVGELSLTVNQIDHHLAGKALSALWGHEAKSLERSDGQRKDPVPRESNSGSQLCFRFFFVFFFAFARGFATQSICVRFRFSLNVVLLSEECRNSSSIYILTLTVFSHTCTVRVRWIKKKL